MSNKFKIIIMVIFMFFTFIGCTSEQFKGEILKSQNQFDIQSYKSQEGVKAFFFTNKEGIIYKYIIYGTSNYSESGSDIVAAAISVLAINATNSLSQFTDSKTEYNSKEINSKPYLECELIKFNSKQGKDESIVLMKSLQLGLKDIEKQYGSKFLNVIEIKDN